MGFVSSDGKLILDDNLGRFSILNSKIEVLKTYRSSVPEGDWLMCGAWWDEPNIRYVHCYYEGESKVEIGKADESDILESKQVTVSFGAYTPTLMGGRFLNDHYYIVGYIVDYPSSGMISGLIAKIAKDYTVSWAKVYSDPDTSVYFNFRGLEYFDGKLVAVGAYTIAVIDDGDGSLIAGRHVEGSGGEAILGGIAENVKASPDRIFVFNPYYLVVFDHSLNVLACKSEQEPFKCSGGCSAGIAVKPDGNILALSEGNVNYPGRIIIEFSPDGVVQQAKRLASSYSGFDCGLKAEIVNDRLYACWQAASADSLIAYLISCKIDLTFPDCPIWADETITYGDLAYTITDAIANVEDATVNIADVTSKFSPVSTSFTKECPVEGG